MLEAEVKISKLKSCPDCELRLSLLAKLAESGAVQIRNENGVPFFG